MTMNRLFFIIVGSALLINTAARAQVQTHRRPEARSAQASKLEAQPFRFGSLGLEIRLPLGARVTTERLSGQESLAVQDGQDAPRWSLRINRATGFAGGPTTTEGMVEQQLKRLREAGAEFTILKNEDLEYGGRKGRACYIQRVNPDGQAFIAGRLFVESGPAGSGRFLQFSVITLPDHYALTDSILHESFSTLKIRTERDITSERKDALIDGHMLLSSMTPKRVRSLVGLDEWLRIYAPAGSKGERDREIGCTHIEIAEGRRGELNAGRPLSSYTALEMEEGLVLRIQGRVILDAKNHQYFDSVGTYWTSWDLTAEAWSIHATRRSGGQDKSESETGVRNSPTTGDPNPPLTVIRSRSNFDRATVSWPLPEVYLPHAYSWVLGQLLPREGDEPRQFGFYSYNGAGPDPSISLRRDTWRPLGDGTGRWELLSRQTVDAEPTSTIFDSQGGLVRKSRPDGSRVEPIELRLLQRIWTRNKLRLTGRR